VARPASTSARAPWQAVVSKEAEVYDLYTREAYTSRKEPKMKRTPRLSLSHVLRALI
jgi:hypothetical protein